MSYIFSSNLWNVTLHLVDRARVSYGIGVVNIIERVKQDSSLETSWMEAGYQHTPSWAMCTGSV